MIFHCTSHQQTWLQIRGRMVRGIPVTLELEAPSIARALMDRQPDLLPRHRVYSTTFPPVLVLVRVCVRVCSPSPKRSGDNDQPGSTKEVPLPACEADQPPAAGERQRAGGSDLRLHLLPAISSAIANRHSCCDSSSIHTVSSRCARPCYGTCSGHWRGPATTSPACRSPWARARTASGSTTTSLSRANTGQSRWRARLEGVAEC